MKLRLLILREPKSSPASRITLDHDHLLRLVQLLSSSSSSKGRRSFGLTPGGAENLT